MQAASIPPLTGSLSSASRRQNDIFTFNSIRGVRFLSITILTITVSNDLTHYKDTGLHLATLSATLTTCTISLILSSRHRWREVVPSTAPYYVELPAHHTSPISMYLAFPSQNISEFFIASETTPLPMYPALTNLGARYRKYRAASSSVIYTPAGSISSMWGAILPWCQSTTQRNSGTNGVISLSICLASHISFSIKIPPVPVHPRSLEAHVEAPAKGSIIPAALILKLGGFGSINISYRCSNTETRSFVVPPRPMAVYPTSHASHLALQEQDAKKITANPSVAHMTTALLGSYTSPPAGSYGCPHIMPGHGLTAASAFLPIGTPYDRDHTRTLYHLSGLYMTFTKMQLGLSMMTLGNIALPTTINSTGESAIPTAPSEANISFASIAGMSTS